VLERGVVYSIVKILLCEGEDVEQWLEPQNMSWCLRLSRYLSTLSLFISFIAFIVLIHMLDIVCVPSLMFNQESI